MTEETAEAPKAELSVGERSTRLLPCRLEDAELAAAVREACAARREVEAKEEELKAVTGDLREILKTAKAAYNHSMDLLEQGKGDKEVTCEERLDYENGIVIVERLDKEPGDPEREVEKRAMSDEERQLGLPGMAVDGAGQVHDPADYALPGEDDEPRPIVCPHCGQDHTAEDCPSGEAPQRVENIEGRRGRRKKA